MPQSAGETPGLSPPVRDVAEHANVSHGAGRAVNSSTSDIRMFMYADTDADASASAYENVACLREEHLVIARPLRSRTLRA